MTGADVSSPRTLSPFHLALVVATALGPACNSARTCREAMDARHFDAAAAICPTLFGRTGDRELGRLAGRALVYTGKGSQAASVAAALVRAGDQAGGAFLRAEIALAARDFAAARDALGRAAAGAAGDPELAARERIARFTLERETARHAEAFAALAEADALVRQHGFTQLERAVLFSAADLLIETGDLGRAELALRMAAGRALPEDAASLRYRQALIDELRGRHELALVEYEEARALAPAGQERLAWSAALARVTLLLARGESAAARKELAAAWTGLPARLRGAEAEAQYRLSEAWGHRSSGDFAAAEGSLAAARARAPRNQDLAWSIDHQEGLLRLAQGRLGEAAHSLERAAAQIEQMRAAFDLPSLRDRLAGARKRPFADYFDLEVKRGDLATALGVAERVQSRNFIDAFAAPDPPRGLDLPGRAIRFASLASLMPPLGRSAIAHVQPIGESLRALADATVLFYFEGRRDLTLIRLHRGELRAFALGASAGLRERVRSFRRDPGGGAAASLAAALLPSDALPAEGTRLYVVPSPLLASIPFAALRLSDGRPLIRAYELALVPSLSALAWLLRRPAAGPPALTVLADPTGDLPGARSEATLIPSRVGGSVRIHIGAEATRARLRAVPGNGAVHIAAHSGVAASGGWLRLADGTIGVGELLADARAPRLAILASCASAASDQEGFWGSLAGMFLASGATAVLSTLWAVEDGNSRDLVVRFYEEGGLRDPIAALARAQRSLLDRPVAMWAPFVLVGASR